MPPLDYYRILGVTPRTDLAEIRRRYRALALKYHPDHNPDDPDAAAHFRQLVEAYEAILAVKVKTRRRAASAQNYRRPRSFDRDTVFEEFFGISAAGNALDQSPGADFRYDLQITFLSAIRGLETDIEVPRTLNCQQCGGTGLARGSGYQSCPDCQGRGRRHGGPGLLRFGPVCRRCEGRGRVVAHPCENCQGRGRSQETRHYRLRIPPCTEDGDRLSFPGEGGEGFLSGLPGTLEVVIHVEPHALFTRVGSDIHCQVTVSFAQAILGGAVRIPTLEGDRTFTLPRGTKNGKLFRVPGAGIPESPRHPRGDQIVEVLVAAPHFPGGRPVNILEEMAPLG